MPKIKQALSSASFGHLILAAWLLSLASPAHPAEVINRIVLRVNDRIATLYDYLEFQAQRRQQLLQDNLEPEVLKRSLDELGESVFKDMFDDLLLLSRADQLEVFIPEFEVDRMIRQMREEAGMESEEEFAAAIQRQFGVPLSRFREQWARQLRMREVVGAEVQRKIKLAEEDLRRYYRDHRDEFMTHREVHVREVVVLDTSDLTAEERQRLAAELHGQLAAGKTLEEVAEGAAPGSLSGVIDHGWIEQGDLARELEDAVWNLAIGEVSPPVPARGGIHLLRVVDIREPRLRSFDEVQEEIDTQERTRLFRQEFDAYMEDLERRAYVYLDPPEEAAGFRLAPRRAKPDPFEILEPASEEAAEPGDR